MDTQIAAEDLKLGYRCRFSEDKRLVTISVGTQWIAPHQLEFGGDLPADAGEVSEQFDVSLEVPVHDGFAMMAMARVEIYSHSMRLHARFGKSVDEERFMVRLVSQMVRIVRAKRSAGHHVRPATRSELEGFADKINDIGLEGDVGEAGRLFAVAWCNKNLARAGESAKAVFISNAIKLYEDARRSHCHEEEPRQTQGC